MILMLTIIPVLDVVNRVISKLIVPTMKTRREEQPRNLRRRAKLKEPTLLDKIMMLELEALNKRGVNCLMKDFQKFWTRMTINAESQKNQSDQPTTKLF